MFFVLWPYNIYRDFTTEGMTVIDTHLGSGSNRISASKANVLFTAYEINEFYYNDQQKRYNNFKSQLRIF